ncbi:hypothetical protein HDU93_003964 [Gonapodya sp. JEL0774]|nr:hypothetical protein HDU93_003964 [Gonapodya sp. JEL0774]
MSQPNPDQEDRKDRNIPQSDSAMPPPASPSLFRSMSTTISKSYSSVSPAYASADSISSGRKSLMLLVLTVYAFAGSAANVMVNPSLLAIETDLNTSAQAVNSSASVASFMTGVAPLFWAPLADARGRRFTCLISGPIGIAACLIGVFVPNIGLYYVARILQQIGSSAVLVAGAGTIADIFPREKRGSALGHFYLGLTGGAAVGPALGGVIAQYLGGWRATFVFASIFWTAIYLLLVLLIPETLPKQALGVAASRDSPLRVLQMNFNKAVLAIVLLNATTFGVLFTINVTIARDFPTFYGFSISQAGYVQLFMGSGMLLTTFVSGYMTDTAVRTWKARRHGVAVPEDRLRNSWVPLTVLVLGCLIHGWSIRYRAHWTVPAVGAWLTGFGMMGFGTPLNSYLIDLVGPMVFVNAERVPFYAFRHKFATRAASIIAAANFLRFTFASLGPLIMCVKFAGLLFTANFKVPFDSLLSAPAYDHIGSGWLYTIWAIVNFFAFLCVVPATAMQARAVLGTHVTDAERGEREGGETGSPLVKSLGGGLAEISVLDSDTGDVPTETFSLGQDSGMRYALLSQFELFLCVAIALQFQHTFAFRSIQVDTGVVQTDAVTVDRSATLARFVEFLQPGSAADQFLETEPIWLHENTVDVVAVDAPYLPLSASRKAGILSVIVSNFTWDSILEHLADGIHKYLVKQVTTMYKDANYLIRMGGEISIPSFPKPAPPRSLDIPLVARVPRTPPSVTRNRLGISSSFRILLVAFGGHDLRHALSGGDDVLPDGWIAVVVGPAGKLSTSGHGRRFMVISDPTEFVPDLVSCADVVLGKLGYGTCSEVLALHKPLLYVPRPDFVEEAGLLRLMQQHGKAVEMPWPDFSEGRWKLYIEEAALWNGVPQEKVVIGGEVAIVESLERWAGQ